MATTYVSIDNLTRYDGNIKTYVDSDKTKSIKGYLKKNNTHNFYNTDAPAQDTVPVFSIDIPTEYFLDQAKTTFVQSFSWSEGLYPGSENPNLDGKPVWIMAVKGDDNSVTYSFVNLEALVDIYTGENTKSITLVVSEDNKISANVNVSAEEGNIISVKDDGIYASVAEVDISSKADKLVDPAEGAAVIKADQILVDDGTGNISASGKTIAELSAEIKSEFVAMTDEEIDGLFA